MMTSEIESLKTNEFLRRRKLRLQQVREQSKDIAKKLRQRANVEKLRQTGDLDAKKQKEYFEKQEKLVKRLEVLYARGLDNVGASHRSASEVRQRDNIAEVDLSKVRAKEAATELKKKKQQKLDEQKKLLDRKLQAREAANELSREKSSIIANKLLTKPSSSKDSTQNKGDSATYQATKENDNQTDQGKGDSQDVTTTDMATQWDFEGQPSEWEPAVPTLTLPKEDRDSIKESESNIVDSKSSKRLDLFALSKEMPSSLRGGNINIPDERIPVKPSLTLVSEYLQSRGLRLRESDTSSSNKKPSEDFHSIKQTIQRTRASRAEVSGKASNNIEKSRSNSQDSTLIRKNSVTMYNHSTRNTQDVPCHDNKLVVRDRLTEEDAYAQAMRETTADNMRDKEYHKKITDMRNKVAMTKQSVEKEYKDTMKFLNSIPKDKCSKGVRNSYMDHSRQQMVNENRQHKLQQEYRKIEKECKRQHNCNKSQSKSKSPIKVNTDIDNDFESRDFQYSWMPVPESDGNLAIHTIPTTTKEGKAGNTVKFSKVDSYHEYRSRHKHTPPTKDTACNENLRQKVTETVINDKSSDSTDRSSVSSDTSSVEELQLETKNEKRKNQRKQKDQNMSDAERIIVYKILDSRSDKKSKKKAQAVNEIAKSYISTDKVKKSKEYDNIELARKRKSNKINNETENRVSFEQLNEGIYKMVTDKGNNITSMYFTDDQLENEKSIRAGNYLRNDGSCSCKKPTKEQRATGNTLSWECGDDQQPNNQQSARIPNISSPRAHTPKPKETPTSLQPSATTSSASYKTVVNDKPNVMSKDGFIKLVDDAGQEAGKFYIGATGFFKDDDYEMVIQLKKKAGNDEKLVLDTEQKVVDKTNEKEVVQVVTDLTDKSADEEVRDILAEPCPVEIVYKRSSPERICNGVPDTHIPPKETTTEQKLQNHVSETSDDVDIRKPAASKNSVADKGVSTSFHLSYAIPTEMPKVDPAPRPATSACTQTTLSSPNHRPVLFHMSSSTSTAYMSPPEMVLPKFLRHDFYLPENETAYEPVQRVEITHRRDTCQRYPDCTCKRCTHARKVAMKVNGPSYYRSEYEHKMHYTPPNTARSCNSGHRHDHAHKHRVDASPIPTMAKCKCQKCESRIRSKTSVKTDSQKCKRNFGGYKRTNGIINARISSSNTPRSKQRVSSSYNSSRINPVIKDYVDRLLDLNKEGLKVIEVVDQECSSVPTPGSSIINEPCNVDERKGPLEKKISLEQIKNILKRQIFEEHLQEIQNKAKDILVCAESNKQKILKPSISRKPRLKPVHKVKSLNISKHLLKTKQVEDVKKVMTKPVSTSTTDDNGNTLGKPIARNTKCRSKSSPTPRQVFASKSASGFTDSNIPNTKKSTRTQKPNCRRLYMDNIITANVINKQVGIGQHINSIFRSHRATITSTSPDSGSTGVSQKQKPEIPISMSTQTSQNVDSEASFMKLAEDKLHNMEKIADLTEKCTQRLSNLAKVLEEVRKNKSLAYSAISTSDSTSDSDQKSDKVTPIACGLNDNSNIKLAETKSYKQEKGTETEKEKVDAQLEFVPFLTDIPKPAALKVPNSSILQSSKSVETLNLPTDLNITPETGPKCRTKPPPALSRIHLKHGQDLVIPHELSTVLEVDSPMSIKNKNQSSRNEIKSDILDNASTRTINNIAQNQEGENRSNDQKTQEMNVNPDLLQSNMEVNKHKQYKSSSTETSDESKFQMIDLKHFNDIMLEPFISIHEYAKQYNVETLDEGSNIEEAHKEVINDDMSSLHSDGSLPDVIAELLKRNIIAEPFKFDTASNINSTTISSESTMSVLALSKVRKEKKKSSVMFQNNKENIAETSDSLSISSNPDLENAFKKLGMGWASSTLKKTKERLALSSSSNTSSSSMSQYKIKSFNQDIPALVTESVSSVLNSSKRDSRGKTPNECSKNAEQQTSLINSMTVKEFLTNELAKKITFTNKSNRNDTEEEFVSLFETKMPDEMKEGHSMSMLSGGNNRARTSTPVQIFKSLTYQSSSSSNISNGLFSNADDLSSVKMTSNSMKNNSTSDKDDLTVPNISLRIKKSSDCSKSD